MKNYMEDEDYEASPCKKMLVDEVKDELYITDSEGRH